MAAATSEDHMMKLSARNQLKGKVVDVVKGATTSHVRIDIGAGVIVMSSITNEAVADLGLKTGDEVWAVIKASDVMVGK
jgi:molybdopterin-binding protein